MADTRPSPDPVETDTSGTGASRADTIRTIVAGGIAAAFALGMLGVFGYAITTLRDPVEKPPASNIPDGPWRGTITWDNGTTTAVWFRSKNGRVRQLTVYQPPSACTPQAPLNILTHATSNDLTTRSTNTSPWTITAQLETQLLLTGTFTPREPCAISGDITAWPRTS